jgi:hypothetical protein
VATHPFVVRAGREHLDDQHRQILRLLRRHRYTLWRTWELKEQLRDLYRSTDPADARTYLKRWCTTAKRSRIPAFANLVRRIEKHFDAIIAAVELGLSNSRLEGINAKIRLVQRRGLRLPQPRRPHRRYLPLPRRNQPQTTHRKVSSRTGRLFGFLRVRGSDPVRCDPGRCGWSAGQRP